MCITDISRLVVVFFGSLDFFLQQYEPVVELDIPQSDGMLSPQTFGTHSGLV